MMKMSSYTQTFHFRNYAKLILMLIGTNYLKKILNQKVWFKIRNLKIHKLIANKNNSTVTIKINKIAANFVTVLRNNLTDKKLKASKFS